MKYKTNEKIKLRKEKETSLIFDPEEDNFIELNESALEILELCKEGKNQEEITHTLSEKYNVLEKNMAKDVKYVIDLLVKIKVLKVDENK